MSSACEPPSDIDAVVDSLLIRLSVEQQVALLAGEAFWRTGGDRSVGLRPMVLSDGPVGVRGTRWDHRAGGVRRSRRAIGRRPAPDDAHRGRRLRSIRPA